MSRVRSLGLTARPRRRLAVERSIMVDGRTWGVLEVDTEHRTRFERAGHTVSRHARQHHWHQCARNSASTVAIPEIIKPAVAITASRPEGSSKFVTAAMKIAT